MSLSAIVVSKLGEDMATAKLAKDVITDTTSGYTILGGTGVRGYQASIAGSGTVSCTVTVQGTNEPPAEAASLWVLINAFSLTGTTNDSQIHASVIPWNAVRVVTASITGTDATVQVTVSTP